MAVGAALNTDATIGDAWSARGQRPVVVRCSG
jgi:hypothetical protein